MPQEEIQPIPAQANEKSEVKSSGLILHVDDDEKIRKAFLRTVSWERPKDKVVSVGSVREAIEKILAGPLPDLIFSDMSMEGSVEIDGKRLSTGRDFYDWLQKKYPALLERFYFVCSEGANPDTDKFLRQKNIKWIEKPDFGEAVRKTVTEILG